jgi:hypothetical protein
MTASNRKVPTIRVTDLDNEYIVFLEDSGRIETIIVFTHGRTIGTESTLHHLPWSARWQIEQELSNFVP